MACLDSGNFAALGQDCVFQIDDPTQRLKISCYCHVAELSVA